jgi:hypothetical protein
MVSFAPVNQLFIAEDYDSSDEEGQAALKKVGAQEMPR